MTNPSAVHIRDLTIADPADAPVLSIPRLDLPPGGRLALMGRSGAGKSTLARALIGDLAPGLRARSGSVTVDGVNVLAARTGALRRIRRRAAYVDQDPGAALTPWLRVRHLVDELETTRGAGRDLLRELGLPTDDAWLRRRPPEISGGQRRRVAIARALASDPGLVILDEPTAGLDRETAQVFLDLLTSLSGGRSLVVVTHDRGLAGVAADRIVTLDDGVIVCGGPDGGPAPGGPTPGFGPTPCGGPPPGDPPVPDPSPPAGDPSAPGSGQAAAHTSAPAGGLARAHRLTPVRGFTLDSVTTGHSGTAPIGPVEATLPSGTVTALVGRSGSGKSTLLRTVAGLHPALGGRILLDGSEIAPALADRSRSHIHALALVPQESAVALVPTVRVGRRLHRLAREHEGDLARVCDDLGLGADLLARTPGALSGGQRQRVVLAAALLRRPTVLLVDEPTAALDAATSQMVTDRLRRAAADGSAVLVATHDPIVVAGCVSVLSLD